MEDDGFGLLAIDISDGDDEETRPSSASTDKPPTSTMTREELRVARTEQTEEQFQEVRRTWRPKVENGEASSYLV